MFILLYYFYYNYYLFMCSSFSFAAFKFIVLTTFHLVVYALK